MKEKINVSEIFGSHVFNDSVMKARLPKAVYKDLKKTIEEGTELNPAIADVVANEMKEWAIEKGATHYTHWFQPLTGVTAEKHDAFINPTDDGKVLLSKQEDIQHGIVHHQHSSKKQIMLVSYVFQQHSVHTKVKH